jgi:Ca2+/H+ antiporter
MWQEALQIPHLVFLLVWLLACLLLAFALVCAVDHIAAKVEKQDAQDKRQRESSEAS